MAKLLQASLAAGEVSKGISPRTDLAKRRIAAELVENFTINTTGGAVSRPGGKFIAQCKATGTDWRLLPFEFNTEQTFIVELGEQYARFYTNAGQVLDSDTGATITGATAADPVVVTTSASHGYTTGEEVFVQDVVGMTELNGRNFQITVLSATTFSLQNLEGDDIDGSGYTAYVSGGESYLIYEIATPYADDDLFEINYAQSGDILSLAHPDYAPRELVRVENDNWTLNTITNTPDQAHPTNLAGNVNTVTTSAAISGISQADPAVVTTSTAHGLAEGDEVRLSGIVGMTELNNYVFKVNTVPSTTTFSLVWRDSGETVDSTAFTAYTSGGTVDIGIAPRRYTVVAYNGDTDEQSLTGISIAARTITNITQANPAVVTTSEGHGYDALTEIDILSVVGMTELNGQRFLATRIDPNTFSLAYLDGTAVDSTSFTAYTSGGTSAHTYEEVMGSAETLWNNTIYWDAVAGANRYEVFGGTGGGVLGFIGTTTGTYFTDNHLDPDYSVTPPRLRQPFLDLAGVGNKNPGAVGFYEQRRIFAQTTEAPNKFFFTNLGQFDAFTQSNPAQDDEAIIGTIAARRINEIRHIVPLTDLILFTSGGEYRAFAGEQAGLSPTNLNVKPQSYYGSNELRPIVAGSVGLFMQPGNIVRDFSYEFASDKFTGTDLSILARHLFKDSTFPDWTFAQSVDKRAFAPRGDGSALFFTYDKEQEIFAWSRATTKGSYESTAAVREGDRDVIYYVVKRKIGGVTRRFVERFDTREFTELSDAFCVDAGLTLDAPFTITDITAADPVVVTTSTAHGLSNGDYVDINGVYEEVDQETSNTGEALSEDYNGTGYIVANVTATTFELQLEDGDYDGSSFAAYSSGGQARQAVTTVGGLWHLEGETVVAAANGYSIKGLVVTNGQITVDRSSRVHAGIGYTCRLITLPIEFYGQMSTDGRLKNVTNAVVTVEDTVGLWYGPAKYGNVPGAGLREANFGQPANFNQPLAMVTTDLSLTLKPGWDREKRIQLEQRDPLPLTITALVPDVTPGGN